MEIRCNEQKALVSRSGFRAIYGGFKIADKEIENKIESRRISEQEETFGSRHRRHRAIERRRISEREATEPNIFERTLEAWTPLIPIYAILLLCGIMVGLASRDRIQSKGVCTLALVAFFVLLIQVGIGFPIERQLQQELQRNKDLTLFNIVVKHTAWFWTVMVFNTLAILSAGLEWFAARIYEIPHSSTRWRSEGRPQS